LTREYRRTRSVSELTSQLGWQSLEERSKNARLSLFYEGLHGLAAVLVDELQHPTRCTRYSGTDTFENLYSPHNSDSSSDKIDTFTVMSSHIDAYKFTFLSRTVTDWNALPASTRAKQSTDAFKKHLHKFPDTPAEPCHSSSNGWSPIAGYPLKNWRAYLLRGIELFVLVTTCRQSFILSLNYKLTDWLPDWDWVMQSNFILAYWHSTGSTRPDCNWTTKFRSQWTSHVEPSATSTTVTGHVGERLQAGTEDAPVLDRPAPLRHLHDSGAGYKYRDLLIVLRGVRMYPGSCPQLERFRS